MDGKPAKKEHRCDGCGKEYSEAELEAAGTLGLDGIRDASMRLSPGGTMPSGECPDPDCGALVFPIAIDK